MQPKTTPLGEFDLIKRFFKTPSDLMLASNPGLVKLGIGDDCALIQTDAQEEIAITSDMLVSGRHFFEDANPEWLGWKALAVNLSDLAAMGAKPLGFTLALAMPEVHPDRLEAFSKGLFTIASHYSCPLIGGDTTAGPLNICITAFGSIPKGSAIRRSGALDGDDIWVSGTVGDARLMLAALRHEIDLPQNEIDHIEARMHQPTPRVELGIALREIANAAVDISDGLLGDLRHILQQSHKDAEIFLDRLPRSTTLLRQSVEIQNRYAAAGGDDYELCFTAPASKRDDVAKISASLHLPLTQIGSVGPMQHALPEIRLFKQDGTKLSTQEASPLLKSFDHFS
jgi:thiamine-monophosphate kinase